MVFVRRQPLIVTEDSVHVTGAGPQASVAVGGVTLAQVGTVGLQPRFTVGAGQPESTGGVVSIVQV